MIAHLPLIDIEIDDTGLIKIDVGAVPDSAISAEDCHKLYLGFKGLVRGFEALANYVISKERAIEFRRVGVTEGARRLEADCDEIYQYDIPTYLKYW